MKLLRNPSTYLLIALVLFACCAQETEAVRRVLRGRRTLTRVYFSGPAIPGWAIALVVGIGEVILGAVLYFILRKVILSKDVEQTNTYAPAATNEV